MTANSVDTMSVTSRPTVFTKCCFCIPLRIGCFILGYLSVIFNTLNTLGLLAVTTIIGVTTHGFDHYDPPDLDDTTTGPMIEAVERPYLNNIGVLLLVILAVNVAWLAINIACLVGLHKKRSGPIRVYVAFATSRLLFAFIGFIYVVMTAGYDERIIIHSIDLGLTAYFILVYYIYAMQLERDIASVQATQAAEEKVPEIYSTDVAFIYPTKIDKEKLIV
ncbi:unnamed protein product [Leptosia nina]|uniref:Uncharacterized protein n=1 Tax=Leptosia nina TaxID=320188 RepID=A0AAV1IZR8_9NEOP